MEETRGGGAQAAAPTREAVEAAFAKVGGGPVTMGRLTYAMCEVLGVDTTPATGSYGLRRLFPYQQFVTLVRRMIKEGEVEARPRREWTRFSGGRLAWDGNQRDLVYATAEAALGIRVALTQERGGRELALHLARQRVLQERAADVEAYAAELLAQWKEERSEGGSGDD